MAVSAGEQVRIKTEVLEAAMYSLLDACDDYRETVEGLLSAEQASLQPRDQLTHRLGQLKGRADQIVRILEDDALTVLLPMLDRLFAIERAEAGVDI